MNNDVESAVPVAAGPKVSEASLRRSLRRAAYGVYGLCAAVSIAVWFLAIGAPLWIDETIKVWSIAKGFWQIPFRQDGLTFPAYPYILWLATKVLGTSEIAMRIPSALAMLGAAWVVYLVAREMFDRDVSAIAVVVFCLEPVVVFASVDVSAYAFATLASASAILLMLRLRRTESNGAAVLLGLAAAVAIWFHFLFAVIVPALAVCMFAARGGNPKVRLRQFCVAAGAFALGSVPVIPGVVGMFRTKSEHVYMPAPHWMDLIRTLVPGAGWSIVFLFGVVAVLLAAVGGRRGNWDWAGRDGLICVMLGLIPLLILVGVSILTPLHISAPPWHLLSAAPGIALCWAWLARALRGQSLRLLFCVFVLWAGASQAQTALTVSRLPSEKRALAVAEKHAASNGEPVLICSDIVESNYEPMPINRAKESALFAALAYYRLSVPVVPLPKELNAEAMRVGGEFIDQATARHEQFLAMGHEPSYPILEWLAKRTAGAYSVRVLGVFSDVKVMEFTPLAKP